MKSVKVSLDSSLDEVELHVWSDWHIGDKSCNLSDIKAEIDSVAANDKAYVILNGDLMNNATKTSVSDSYAEQIPPMEQLNTLCELLEPVKHKVVLVSIGNHEARTYRTDGIDLMALVAQQLGIADRYVKEGGILFLRLGLLRRHDRKRQVCYTFYVTHGSGGGKKEGAKATILADMASIVDTDIYVHGHSHLPMIMKEGFFRIDVSNSTVARVDKLFVNTSAALEYGGYGQTYEFKPSSTHNPIIYLSGTKKHFTAKL